MTKKNIILILVIVCFLTIMTMSIWGKQPEIPPSTPVSELVIFDNENELVTEKSNNGNYKIEVDVGDKFDKENPQTYVFTIAVLPEDATSLDITYEIRTQDYENLASIEKQEADGNKHKFVITFKEDYFKKPENINIDFYSTGSGTRRYAYLTLVSTIKADGGEIIL